MTIMAKASTLWCILLVWSCAVCSSSVAVTVTRDLSTMLKPVVIGPPMQQSQSFLERHLQTSTGTAAPTVAAATDNFRVDYSALVQAVQSPTCTSPKPIVRLFCGSLGSNSSGTLDTSNLAQSQAEASAGTATPTIVTCTPYTNVNSSINGVLVGTVGAECTLGCVVDDGGGGGTSGNGCFTNNGTFSYMQGNFAAIPFSCVGPTLDSVIGTFTWEDNGDGSCSTSASGSSSSSSTSALNYRIAQLGVNCNGGAELSRIYNFDDHFTDCDFAVPIDRIPGDDYACFSGLPCAQPDSGDANTCVVDFDPMILLSQPYNFPSRCIAQLTTVAIPEEPNEAPLLATLLDEGSLLTAKFQASFGVSVIDSYTGESSGSASISGCGSTEGAIRSLRIECINDNATLVWLDAESDVLAECTALGTNTLMCTNDGSTELDGSYLDIVYECTASTVPSSTVQFFPGEASCSASTTAPQTTNVTVLHSLRLATSCTAITLPDTVGTTNFWATDYFTECGPLNQFSTDAETGAFTCSSRNDFTPTTRTIPQIVSPVLVSTDTFWSAGAGFANDCLTVAEGMGTTATPSSSASAPAAALPPTTPGAVAPQQAQAPLAPTTKLVWPTTPPVAPSSQTATAPVAAAGPGPTNISFVPPTNIAPIPNLKNDSLFAAAYVGQFQYLQDSNCTSPNPTLLLYCMDNGNVTVGGKSDMRIQCMAISPTNEHYMEDANGLTCQVDCVDEACAEIFVSKNGGYGDGPFGQIYFQCAGDTLSSTAALFGMAKPTSGGSCGDTVEDPRNLRVVRLGASCPASATATATVTSKATTSNLTSGLGGLGRKYSFDEYYFECLGDAAYPYAPATTAHDFVCLSGPKCFGADCTFELNSVLVTTDTANLYADRCIEAAALPDGGNSSAAAAAAPVDIVTSVAFQATWGIQYDTDIGSFVTSERECVDASQVSIEMSCPNAQIELVSASSSAIACNASASGDVLTCMDQNVSMIGAYESSVVYNCTGAGVPTTTIEYPSTEAYCADNIFVSIVRHALQLGVYCNRSETTAFVYNEYSECGPNQSSTFDLLDDVNYYTQSIYTCYASSPDFAKQSDNSTLQSVPAHSMSTDTKWLSEPDVSCYTVVSASIDSDISTASPSTALNVSSAAPATETVDSNTTTTSMPAVADPPTPSVAPAATTTTNTSAPGQAGVDSSNQSGGASAQWGGQALFILSNAFLLAAVAM